MIKLRNKNVEGLNELLFTDEELKYLDEVFESSRRQAKQYGMFEIEHRLELWQEELKK